MKTIKYHIIAIILCCSSTGYSQNNDLVAMEIFLDREFLKELSIDAKFISSIEYAPYGLILLASDNQFYFLGIGGLIPVFEYGTGINNIESFALTPDTNLVVVSGNALYELGSEDPFSKVRDIPGNNMGITAKYGNIYIYDRIRENNKSVYSIYQLSGAGEITTLATSPNPVSSVFEQPDKLIFSSKNQLFTVDIKSKQTSQILSLPQEVDIISIAGNAVNQSFYFSTANAIYQIKDGKFELITEDFGGILMCDNEGLFVFAPENQLIVRLRNNLLYPVADNGGTQNTTNAQGCNFNQTAKRHWDRAEALRKSARKAEDYYDVAKEYETAATYAPNCPNIYYNLALCYELLCSFNSENCDIAIDNYRKHLELNTNADDRRVVQNKINSIERKKEFTVDKINEKGINAFNEKNYTQAIEYFKQIIRINPNFAAAYYNIGRSYDELSYSDYYRTVNDYYRTLAIVYFKKTIDIDPNHALAYLMLGHKTYDIDMALNYHRKYVSFYDSNNAMEYYNAGTSRFRIGTLAIAYLERAISIYPDFAEAYASIGYIYYMHLAGNYTQSKIDNSNIWEVPKVYEAIASYERAAHIASKDKRNKEFCGIMYNRIGLIYLEHFKDTQSARYYFQKAAKLGNKSARYNKRGLR